MYFLLVFLVQKDCLANISVFSCDSSICSEFFYQLSQICHNIETLTITFEDIISDGLVDLISLQRNLKYVALTAAYGDENDWTEILSSLTKFSLTLTKLEILGYDAPVSLSFLNAFMYLQEIILSFYFTNTLVDFNKLQYVTFPQLHILKFPYAYPEAEMLIQFLEINGKNLTEFYVGHQNNSLNLAVAKFCSNLKKLRLIFKYDELETLKMVFNNCQYLESIKIRCGGDYYLEEKEMLEMVSKYSPKNFYELKVEYIKSLSSSEELELFFMSWRDRVPQKPLSFIISTLFIGDDINSYVDMEIIEKYKTLDVIKKFETEKLNEI